MLKTSNDIKRSLMGSYPVVHPKQRDWICRWIELEKMMTSINWLTKEMKLSDVHKVMKFDSIIFLDCGIFQLFPDKGLSWEKICEYREKLIDWYRKLRPDMASALDVPSLIWSKPQVKKERIIWSLKNFLYMQKELKDHIILIPGACAFSEKSVNIVADRIKQKIGSPFFLGVGGYVPLMRIVDKKPELGKIIVKTLSLFRKKFPDAFIHVYGAGGHRWYMLMRLLGADSADYAGYMRASGMGKIFLPGLGPKHILKQIRLKTKRGYVTYTREKDKLFNSKESTKLHNCTCPICKENDPISLETNRDYRIIHNLYVTLSEAEFIDDYCRENDFNGLANHVRKRLIGNRSGLKSVAEYALHLHDSS